MATPFTTWTALLAQLLDNLASANFTAASYSIAGRSVQYRTLDELRNTIEWVRTMAALESGTAAPRTYAGQGGRYAE